MRIIRKEFVVAANSSPRPAFSDSRQPDISKQFPPSVLGFLGHANGLRADSEVGLAASPVQRLTLTDIG
jgi:hypothetical protein